MNTRQKRHRLNALEIQLDHVQKRIAYHQERLVLVPDDCRNREVWEEVETEALKACKARERRICDEMARLQGQEEFSFSSVGQAHC